MFSSYEVLKSQVDYKMEDVRKTAKQCKNKRKKRKEKNWKTSHFHLEGEV